LRAAQQAGRSLVLIVPSERDDVESFGSHCRIYHVAAAAAPIFDRRYRLLLPPSYWPLARGRVREILQAERPDLVEVCDKYALHWLAGLWRKDWLGMRKRPLLVGMSCERMDDNVRAFITDKPWARAWSRRYLSYCYLPLFDLHLANSDYTANELRAALVPRHARPLHVVPMGADIAQFAALQRDHQERRALLKHVGASSQARLLLYAGRLSPEKNLSLLTETLAILAAHPTEDYHLLIAGDGPLAAQLREQARERWPRRLHLLGHVGERARLLSLYANCDAFVHPNPREPFGIAPLEAMAAGLPLIAPNAGGVLSYANHENAWLAEPRADAFAQAIQSVFGIAPLRCARLAQARARATQFDWAHVTTRFFELYEQLHLQFRQAAQPQSAPVALESIPTKTL
jgi:alpha-1,6-mannosyltransferase